MADNLVKRLRLAGDWARKDHPQFKSQHVTEEAADRIEHLGRELAEERHSREIASQKAWEFSDRIQQLEALLETVMRSAGHDEHEIRAALAGEKPE